MFTAPQTLAESFGPAIFALRFSGIFPYSHHARSNKYRLSWLLVLWTVLQMVIYNYVNFSLMLADWRNYALPAATRGPMVLAGNLILRILALICTMLVILPSMLGSRRLVIDINRQLRLESKLLEMGFDTHRLNREIRIISLISFLTLFLWILLNGWHVIYFYELFSQQKASLYYYLVVVLSDYYTLMYMTFMRIQVFAFYLMSNQLNGFMRDLLKLEQRRYEQRKRADVALIGNI